MVGKCPDWNGLSSNDKVGAPEAELLELVCLPEDDEVVTILLPLSLPLLLNPKAAEDVWFKFKGFLNGLDGV